MEDRQIVKLYLDRDECAISVSKDKYGRYIYGIAYSILHDLQDAEECENDTYLGAWNSIPPHEPADLRTYLGKISRSTALNRHKAYTAEKRGGGETALALEELEGMISDGTDVENSIIESELANAIDAFLRSLPDTERRVFLRRYWYFDSINEICSRFSFGQSKVKVMLLRTRNRLAEYLRKEGMI